MDIFKTADMWIREDIGFAMATIIESKGSTPRHSAKMLIKSNGELMGTIGGGPGEYKVIQDSLVALSNNENTIKEYVFNKNVKGGLPTQCGGTMRVLIEVFPKRRRIVLIGAGYVNQAVMRIAQQMDWRIVVADDRPDYATTALLPEASEIHSDENIAVAVRASNIQKDDICVIATKDCDLDALRETLKSETFYVGMIGSKRKVTKIFETLEEEGVGTDVLSMIHAPIGLDIGAETPTEIAISIMSEVVSYLNKGSGNSMKIRESI